MGVFEIILCIIGVYNVIIGFMMETKNLQSTIIFKVIPLFAGLFLIGYACMTSGFIRIG